MISILFEVLFISVGVFIALLANNWNQDRENHAKTRAALRNFLTETETNLQATKSERDYHEKLAQELNQVVNSSEPVTAERLQQEVHSTGLHPITFEHTAWDLALATQALSYLPPDLAFEISKAYTKQTAFQTLENSFLIAMYTPGTFAKNNAEGYATAMYLYLGDVNVQEPLIIKQYEKVLPLLKAALDGASGH